MVVFFFSPIVSFFSFAGNGKKKKKNSLPSPSSRSTDSGTAASTASASIVVIASWTFADVFDSTSAATASRSLLLSPATVSDPG